MNFSIANMKIGTRLGLSFGVVLTLLLTVALIGVGRLSSMNDTLTATVDFNGAENILISQALGHEQDAATAMRNLLILNDEPRMAIQKQVFDKSLASYDETEKKLNELFSQDPGETNEERDFLKRLSLARDAALPLVDKVAKLGLKNDPNAAEVMMNETAPALDKWTMLLTQFRDYEIKASADGSAEAHNTYVNSRTILFVISGIAILLGVVVAYLVTRSITLPVKQAVKVAETVALGDLTSRIETSRKDEVGQLLQSLKMMNDNLINVAAGIRSSTESVSVASREIASVNIDLSSRTEE